MMEREDGLPPCHPASEYLPLLTKQDFVDLVASIRQNGQRETIKLDTEGRIIDGRNRYRACVAAGVVPRMETVGWTEAQILAYIFDANLTRRHLDAGQRAIIAAQLLRDMRAATGPVGPDDAQRRVGDANREAATMAHVAKSTLAIAQRILRDAPDLAKLVHAGQLSLHRADEVLQEREAAAAEMANEPRRKAAAKSRAAKETLGKRYGPIVRPLTEGAAVDDAIEPPALDEPMKPSTDDERVRVDGAGADVPANLQPVFSAGRQLAAVLAQELSSIVATLRERTDVLDAKGIIDAVSAESRRLRTCAPFAVCPSCLGVSFHASTSCTWCRGRGWFSASKWRSILRLNPDWRRSREGVADDLEESARQIAEATLHEPDNGTGEEWAGEIPDAGQGFSTLDAAFSDDAEDFTRG